MLFVIFYFCYFCDTNGPTLLKYLPEYTAYFLATLCMRSICRQSPTLHGCQDMVLQRFYGHDIIGDI